MLKKAVLGLAFPSLAAVTVPAAAQAHPFGSAEPALLYYVSIPLAGSGRAASAPTFGFAIQGRQASPVLPLDNRVFRLSGGEAFDAKWLLVGGVAAGVALIAADSTLAKPSGSSEGTVARCSARPAC